MIATTTQEIYPYGKRYWYPHMQPEHVALWEKFMERYPDMFENCYYDFALGTIPDFNDPAHPVYVPGQEKLYQKKIDVLGRKNNESMVIEIKPKATASAVGQVKRYRSLLAKEHPEFGKAKVAIVTDSMDDDDRLFAVEEGVQIFEV